MEQTSNQEGLIPARPVKQDEKEETLSFSGVQRKGKLNFRQKKFIQYYLAGKSAYESAILAGYPKSSANVASVYVLGHPAVAAEINRKLSKKFKELDVTADKLFDEVSRIAFANILDFVEVQPDGGFKVALDKVERYLGSAIQEISHDQMGRVKIKLADKKPALELLARMMKLLKEGKDENKNTTVISISNLDAIIKQHVTVKHYNLPNLNKAKVIDAIDVTEDQGRPQLPESIEARV